jgi:hypothetical protein
VAKRVRLFLVVLVAVMAPVYAAVNPDVKIPPDTDGGGTCATSCSFKCNDGSWSSIACLPNECAKCYCNGYQAPVLATPKCV